MRAGGVRRAGGRFVVAILVSGFAAGRADGAGPPGGLSATPVITTGQSLPDVGPVSRLSFPVINASGQILLAAGNGAQDGVYRVEPGGAFTRIAFSGDPAPGIPGARFGFFDYNNPLITSSGGASFLAFLRTGVGGVTDANNRVIYTPGAGNQLVPIVRIGAPAPGGETFTQFGPSPAVSDFGHVGVYHSFSTAFPPTDTMAYVTGPNSTGMTPVARAGTTVSAPAGAVLDQLNYRPLVSDNGTYVFGGRLRTGEAGVTATNRDVVYRTTAGGALELIARSGNPAPGAAAGVNLGFFAGLSINQNDHIVIMGQTSDNRLAIWELTPTKPLTRVIGTGDPAPGLPAGMRIQNVGALVINARDHLAFEGTLSLGSGVTAQDDEVLWGPGADGRLTLVAREGMRAPGTPDGVVFDHMYSHVLNARDQMAFYGNLRGAGVGGDNLRGIWAYDPHGGLVMLVREGEQFEVRPGDTRTVRVAVIQQNLSGNEDGLGTSLSDNGTIVFDVEFTDGSSGIFSAQVPEPGGLGLVGMVSLLLLRRAGCARGYLPPRLGPLPKG